MEGSFIAVLLEVVAPHLHLHGHLAHRLCLQAIPACVSEQHILGLLQLVDVPHQEGAAGSDVARRNHIEDLHLPGVAARRGGKMEVAVTSDHRSPEEVLSVYNQGNLRPASWSLDFVGHLKGKVPHQILLILCGMLADACALPVGQLPAFARDSGVHHRERVIVVKLGGLKHALIADKHGLLLLDLGYEVQLRWLVPQFLTILTRLLLSFEGLLFLLDQHLFHLNFLI